MKLTEIRQRFIQYFESQGHTVVPSSSLIPTDDPTLLFTNSGMVQFKNVFLGKDLRPYKRATSAQRCVRAGGKHNDLENVGYTARHHTFFEMLGNFSFGDYFKRDAIRHAWHLLTKIFGIDGERLLVTVYEDDDEAYRIWNETIGVPHNRIIRIGDNKGARYASDNFWQMADTGPCGPCTEIFYDHGEGVAGGPPGSLDEDGDRYIEVWNLVFMQFDRDEQGNMNPLPKPCVDTGMGLERIAAVLQGVHSNYDIDLFQILIKEAARITHTTDLSNDSLKVLADHIRASSFLIADGVAPSNEGRGYVLRRIIRRAIRHGYKLGRREPFFYLMVPALVEEMGRAYLELEKAQTRVMHIIEGEEKRFFETIEHGMRILDHEIDTLKANHQTVLNGALAFKLHDTFGFPLDLTQDVCRENGLTVDEAGFNAEMDKQRDQARASGKFKAGAGIEFDGEPTTFVGYNQTQSDQTRVVALFCGTEAVTTLNEGQKGTVILEKTPFYGESGGQVGDQGVLTESNTLSPMLFKVEDAQKLRADVIAHTGTLVAGTLNIGDEVCAKIDLARRKKVMRNHSATHLLHKALRDVLGDHVQQKGSHVDDLRTRFDFTHDAPVSSEEMRRIENYVNAEILANVETQSRELSIEDAQKTGAVMLFGEKYGDMVRVLDIGSSRELCGGTHVGRSGDIGLFKIMSEGGVAAGVRRIEAVTATAALMQIQKIENQVHEIAATVKANPNEVTDRVSQLIEQNKQFEKELAQVKQQLAHSQSGGMANSAEEVGNGVKVLATVIGNADIAYLRTTLDQLKDKLGTAAIVLASIEGDKVNLVTGVTHNLTDKVKAGELANFVALQVGGKGGGRADMAQAGGTDPHKLPQALASVKNWVLERV